jgi:hypothetical protein
MPLLQLLTSLEEAYDYLKTNNFWFKTNGKLIKNDKLHFPYFRDYLLYQHASLKLCTFSARL